MKYRIQINELSDGTKKYIPQVCKPEITGSFIKRLKLRWNNIVSVKNGKFILLEVKYQEYKTEDEAMFVIEEYKKIEGNKIIATSYKFIG
jgi:Na+-transporting NADH:ubiquinone oxidoreductase subunit NqrF